MSDPELEKFLTDRGYHVMTADEAESFGKLAGESYSLDYPLFKIMFGDKVNRQMIVDAMTFQYKLISKHGLCYSLEDTSIGSLSVETSKTGSHTTWDILRSGFFKLLFRYGPRPIAVMYKYDKLSRTMTKELIDEKTIYIQNLSVAKDYQGKKLIEAFACPLILYADCIGAKICFETHSMSHVQLYNHYGFELAKSCLVPGTKFKHYVLIRRPGSRIDDISKR